MWWLILIFKNVHLPIHLFFETGFLYPGLAVMELTV